MTAGPFILLRASDSARVRWSWTHLPWRRLRPADVVEARPASPRGGRRRCAWRRSPSGCRRGSGRRAAGPRVTSWSIRKIICWARPTAKAGMRRTPPRAKVFLRTPSSWSSTDSVRVRPVAVGALDHQVVGLGRGLGVLRQHGVEAAHVAAEEDARLAAVLPHRDVRGGGAEEVPGVAVGERERVVHLLRPAEGHGPEELERLAARPSRRRAAARARAS